ncbi:MAG: CcmD family protein [Flavobacteriales bacterium]|nr:CcmD family protein [Flavobacteriales bacterium]
MIAPKKKYIALVLFCVMVSITNAQTESALNEYFFESGKFKVVIGVAVIILVGLFAYLFSLDRKVKRLEKKLEGKKS